MKLLQLRSDKICLFLVLMGVSFRQGLGWTTGGRAHHNVLRRQSNNVPLREVVLFNSPEESNEPDLFDYFDPLLSPHSYPNGISPQNQPEERPSTLTTNNDNAPPAENERYNPLQFPKYKENASSMNTAATMQARPNNRLGKQKLGILLMDHGSRNPKSNARLQKLAELYQMTLEDSENDDSEVIVTAAHMEIATPSIPDGLKVLLDQGVDEIVCHPYFLSPGRHATEDIPQIIADAIASMKIEIPVITTDPVGSNTQLMIGAIHSQVREYSTVLQKKSA